MEEGKNFKDYEEWNRFSEVNTSFTVSDFCILSKINVLTQPDVEDVLHGRPCHSVQDAAPRRQEADGKFHSHASHEEALVPDHVLP